MCESLKGFVLKMSFGWKWNFFECVYIIGGLGLGFGIKNFSEEGFFKYFDK